MKNTKHKNCGHGFSNSMIQTPTAILIRLSHMKKSSIVLLAFLMYSLATNATDLPPQYLTGPSTGEVGGQYTYVYDNGSVISNFTWIVDSNIGLKVSETESGTAYTLVVQWIAPGSTTIQAARDIDILLPYGSKDVSISGSATPPDPSSGFSVTQNCNGTATVTRTSGPGVWYAWYWQTSSSGTSTSLGSGASITISSTTDLYLRAQSNYSPYPWSNGSQSAGSITPHQPTNAGSITGAQSICDGASAGTLLSTVDGSGGTGPSYSWERSTDGTNWSAISGTNSYLSSPPLVGGASQNYFRRITTTSCGSAASNSVIVTVYAPLNGGSITGAQTICYNQATSGITSTALGSGGTGTNNYQWQQSSNASTWNNMDGVTNPSSLPSVNLTSNTYFRRLMTNSCGSAASNYILVTVRPALNPGTAGANQTICAPSAPAALNNITSPSGGDGSYTYQWKSSSDGSTWSNISGATASSYSPPGLSTTTYYQRVVTSCLQTFASNTVLITVNPVPTGGTISGAQSICSGATPSTLGNVTSGTGTSTAYTWDSSPDNATWTQISGATASTYSPGALTASTYYRRKNNATCGPVYSNTVLVTVYSALSAGTINGTATICYNTATTLGSTSAASGNTGSYTYQWEQSVGGGSWTTIASANSTTYTTAALTASTDYRRKVTTSCTSVYSNTISITVRASLVAGTIGSNQTICSGFTPATLTNVASPAGGDGTYAYQWKSSTDGTTFTSISGATASTYSPPSLTANKYYQRSVSSCGQTFTTASVLITVNALPAAPTYTVVTPVCGSGSTTIAASNLPAGTVAKWYTASTGGSAVYTGSDFGTSVISTTTSWYLTSYNTTTGCESSPRTQATVNVYSVPAVPTGVTPGARCGTGTVTLSATPGSGEEIRWYTTADVYLATGNSYSPNLTGTTTYRVKSRNTTTGCVSAYATVTATINPIPKQSLYLYSSTVYGYGKVTLGSEDDCPGCLLKWYTAQTGGTAVYTGNTYVTPVLSAPTNYYAAFAYATGCEAVRIAIVADVKPAINASRTITEVIRVPGIHTDTQIDNLTDADKIKSVTYVDGLQRAIQQVTLKVTPLGKDVVQPVEYDSLGRSKKQYLPYVATTTGTDPVYGSYQSAYASQQASYYANGTSDKVADDAKPYAISVFDSSPLGRVVEQGDVGTDWQPTTTTHTQKINYSFNTGSTNSQADEVRKFNADGSSSGFYAANTLNRIESTDAQGNKVIVFTDDAGKTVVKKQQLDEVIDGVTVNYLQTYYTYDDFGREAMIITPKGTDLLRTGSWTLTPDIKDNFCHTFLYDKRGRLIEKKTPGQAVLYYIYDDLNRLLLTQDGLQRASNKWMFYKYDMKGRNVLQGIYLNTVQTTRTSVQAVADGLYTASNGPYPTNAWYESAGTALMGYDNISFPKTNTNFGNTALEIWNVSYYDNYDLDRNGSDDITYTTQGLTGEHTQGMATGMPTASKRRILGTSNFLVSYVLYDTRGRAIQTVSNDHLDVVSLNEITTAVYAYDGRVLTTKTVNNTGGNVTTVINKFEYDGAGRLAKVYQNNNGAASDQLLAQYAYNEIGQMIDKKLHGDASATNFLQSVDYRFNIRGQLTSINNSQLTSDNVINDETNDYFGMELLYNTAESGLSNTTLFNGNISAVKWKGVGAGAGVADQKSYKYGYDNSGKLETATSQMNTGSAWTKEANNLNESMSYDHNGNIKSLQRNQRQHQLSGVTASYTSQTIDNLAYTYTTTTGDKLTKVEDAAANAAGFNNGANATTEYTYDTNGNLTADQNKGISSITYNLLGKPDVINFTDGRKVEYVYDASGTKLTMKSYATGGTLQLTTDYAGQFVYENSNLTFFGSPEGRVVKNGSNLEYQYSIADHQGNTRVVFTSATPAPVAPNATFEGEGNDGASQYQNVSNVVTFLSANHTTGGSKVIRMNQSYSAGPAKSLRVYPGDAVDMEVWAYYESSSGYGTGNISLSSMITNVAGALTAGMTPGAETQAISSGVNSALTAFGIGANQGDTQPAAYLNYIQFDQNYNVLDAGWTVVPATANFAKQNISIPTKNIKEAGFMYVYLSYENQSNNYVYFDDFKVTHTKTNVIQYNEYYPFGLAVNTSWTRENNKNDFLYDAGGELNGASGYYDLFFRNYDPILARFQQVDPLAVIDESLSPFVYGGNNPIFFNDPFGDKKGEKKRKKKNNEQNTNNNQNWSQDNPAAFYVPDGGGGGGTIYLVQNGTTLTYHYSGNSTYTYTGTVATLGSVEVSGQQEDLGITFLNKNGQALVILKGLDISMTIKTEIELDQITKVESSFPFKTSKGPIIISLTPDNIYKLKQQGSKAHANIISISLGGVALTAAVNWSIDLIKFNSGDEAGHMFAYVTRASFGSFGYGGGIGISNGSINFTGTQIGPFMLTGDGNQIAVGAGIYSGTYMWGTGYIGALGGVAKGFGGAVYLRTFTYQPSRIE